MTSGILSVADCELAPPAKAAAPEDHWYALVTAPRLEIAAETTLIRKGYEALAPAQNRGGAKGCVTTRLVFPGYVFCRFKQEDRPAVLATPGVVRVAGHKPIADPEINSLRLAVSLQLAMQPFPYLRAGQRIRIREGAMMGLEGILITFGQVLRVVL